MYNIKYTSIAYIANITHILKKKQSFHNNLKSIYEIDNSTYKIQK